MTTLPLPTTPEELTADTLTKLLRAGGKLGAVRVASLRHEVIGEGVGFIGVVARFSVEYDKAGLRAPRSLIAKFPSPDPGSRQVGDLYGLYEREVRFYNELAAETGIATPACYFAAYDPASGQALVLLEDLREGAFGDQVAGCTLDEARLAVSELAALHARWWQHPRLDEVEWMASGDQLVRGAMLMAYDACLPLAMERIGPSVPAAIAAALPSLGSQVLAVLDGFAQTPLTVIHGDYRLDNMFFGAPGSARPLVVCDWQSPNKGWGAYDLAYFLAGGLEVDARRAHEDKLIALYYDTLRAGGVTGYGFDELRRDYVSALAVMMGIAVVNSGSLPITNDRAVLVFERMSSRFIAALIDHDALEALPVV